MTYQDIASKNGMDYKMAEKYIKFMKARWGNSEELECESGYASEWARRFLRGTEVESCDRAWRHLLV